MVGQGGGKMMEAYPRKEWSWDHNPGSQAQSASARISRLCSTQQWKATRFVSAGERQGPLESKPLFYLILKGAKAQLLCSQPLTLGPSKGKAAQTGVTWVESGGKRTVERRWGAAVGFSMPGYTWSPEQPSFLRRASPSQGKSNYFTLWNTAQPTLHHFFSFSFLF